MQQDSWSWELWRLHIGSVKTHVSTSGCQQELWILPGVRSEAGLPVTQKDRGRTNRLWFWMMGNHHSKDDILIVPSCTRDLEMGMWLVLQPGANIRGKAQGDSFQPQFGGTLSLGTIAHLYPRSISQPLVTSFLTWIRHQLWLSLGILIMGKKRSCQAGIPVKRRRARRIAKFSNRGACPEALIWTVPLSSSLTVSPAGLWWQHAPALKHRAQWQHQNNSRLNKSWRYATFRGACFVSLPNDPSYGCCLHIHPLGKQFGWAKVFKRDAKLTSKIT